MSTVRNDNGDRQWWLGAHALLCTKTQFPTVYIVTLTAAWKLNVCSMWSNATGATEPVAAKQKSITWNCNQQNTWNYRRLQTPNQSMFLGSFDCECAVEALSASGACYSYFTVYNFKLAIQVGVNVSKCIRRWVMLPTCPMLVPFIVNRNILMLNRRLQHQWIGLVLI